MLSIFVYVSAVDPDAGRRRPRQESPPRQTTTSLNLKPVVPQIPDPDAIDGNLARRSTIDQFTGIARNKPGGMKDTMPIIPLDGRVTRQLTAHNAGRSRLRQLR